MPSISQGYLLVPLFYPFKDQSLTLRRLSPPFFGSETPLLVYLGWLTEPSYTVKTFAQRDYLGAFWGLVHRKMKKMNRKLIGKLFYEIGNS